MRSRSPSTETLHIQEAVFRERVLRLGFCIVVGSVLFSFIYTLAVLSIRPNISHTDVLVNAILIPLIVAPLGVWANSRLQMRVFRLLKENHQLAYFDHLTGLMNRRAFFSNADALRNHAVTHHQQLAVMMVDADDFKDLNDSYGHKMGDEALQLIANCLTEVVPSNALVARMGGEEFVVLVLANTTEIERLGHSLCDSVAKASLDSLPTQLTVSVGVRVWDEKTKLSTLLTEADNALYHAKSKGKNRVSNAADTKKALMACGNGLTWK